MCLSLVLKKEEMNHSCIQYIMHEHSGQSDWFKTEKIPQLGSSPTANQDLSIMLHAWATYGPRAKFGPRKVLIRPAKHFYVLYCEAITCRKMFEIWDFVIRGYCTVGSIKIYKSILCNVVELN